MALSDAEKAERDAVKAAGAVPYREKPSAFPAVQLTDKTWDRVATWVSGDSVQPDPNNENYAGRELRFTNGDGRTRVAVVGDWVYQAANGGFYRLSDEEFTAEYEKA